jgi:Putative Flp pilus-assembly TadE/G-like
MRNRNVSSRDSRGQVLIITAFAMVALIAIAAIVVDLGMSWMLHRQEQNAVDPASLAAAKWINPTVNQAKMNAEACFYAQQNGFFVGDVGCAAALASGNLQVHSPPSSTMAGQFRGAPHFVEVIINATHPSFFGQFFGEPFGSVKTAAVAKLTTDNANSSSLIALGDSCNGATNGESEVGGGGTLTIHPATGVTAPGGYVHINAPCGGIGNPSLCDGNGNAALQVSGGGHFVVPHAFVVGGCSTNGGGTLTCQATSPCLDEQAIPLGDPLFALPEPWPTINLPTPTCPKISEINSPADKNPCNLTKTTCPKVGVNWVCTMQPGLYYAGWDVGNSVQVVLKPGMYVFAGFGIKMNAGASMQSATGIDGSGNIIDARVTIFSTDYTAGCLAGKPNFCEGPIQISSSGPLRLKATDKTTCQQVSPEICPWTGILIWQDGTVVGTPGDITINGQADLVLSGTIYAPKSEVTINGGTNGTGCSGSPQSCLAIQIIARQWRILGGGTIDMPYNPADLYPILGQGLVH